MTTIGSGLTRSRSLKRSSGTDRSAFPSSPAPIRHVWCGVLAAIVGCCPRPRSPSTRQPRSWLTRLSIWPSDTAGPRTKTHARLRPFRANNPFVGPGPDRVRVGDRLVPHTRQAGEVQLSGRAAVELLLLLIEVRGGNVRAEDDLNDLGDPLAARAGFPPPRSSVAHEHLMPDPIPFAESSEARASQPSTPAQARDRLWCVNCTLG
jgi:hypothetical protein